MITTDVNEKLNDDIVKDMTNEEWQSAYAQLRKNIPVYAALPSRKPANNRCVRSYCQLSDGKYDGVDTLDKRNCDRIKDILRNIRRCKNKVVIDYVYYFNDIKELMKYESNLVTKIVHKEVTYWKVWISK
jgi:hypothetical protein